MNLIPILRNPHSNKMSVIRAQARIHPWRYIMKSTLQSGKKLALCISFLVIAASAAMGADLFDLRVFPCFASQTVDFTGIIVTSNMREDPTNRRSRFAGLIARWLASGTVTIDSSSQQLTADIKDGEFSGQIKVPSLASFTLIVQHNGQKLYQETFNFPDKADYLVISDIDDTILVTDVTHRIKMVYNSLFKRISKRQPVPGTPEFYQDLSKGLVLPGIPHFIYLSSSPAFLSRSLKAFIKQTQFPQGSVVLKKTLSSSGSEKHKSAWLEQIALKYPGKPLLLIGDSGEKDPVIYQSFVENNKAAGRVKGVIIHEVTDQPEKIKALEQIREQLQKQKIPFIYWNCINGLKDSLKHNLLLH